MMLTDLDLTLDVCPLQREIASIKSPSDEQLAIVEDLRSCLHGHSASSSASCRHHGDDLTSTALRMTEKATLNASNAAEPETHDTWSVDPTIRFDHIHVIESLDSGFAAKFQQLAMDSRSTPERVVM